MNPGAFSVPIKDLCDRLTAEIDIVVRKVTLDVFADVVLRSPVGNPELWAANAHAVAQRDAYRFASQTFNDANPTKRRRATGKSVNNKFPLAVGKGYVGGRFRANWNVSYGTPDESTTDTTDQSRTSTEALDAAIQALPVGGLVFITNAMPYALRLEFGWSTQAPGGVVRLAAQRVHEFVAAATKS